MSTTTAPQLGTTPTRTTPTRTTPTRTTEPAAHLRLTRRGRLLVLAMLVAGLFATFSLGRAATQAAPTGGPAIAAAVQETTVQPGDSLWIVARRIAPDNDPRDVVAQIRRLNDLSSSELRPGQQLLLPVAA